MILAAFRMAGRPGRVLATALIALAALRAPAGAFDWGTNFIDPDDGMPDVSAFLARGGFVPVPVIITDPAVEGGLGVIGQFVHGKPQPDGRNARTRLGFGITGNQSKFGGGLHSGFLHEGRTRYAFGLGAADITLPIFPFGGSEPVDYTNRTFGAFANARTRIGETSYFAGPRFILRRTDTAFDTGSELAERVVARAEDLLADQQYVALGLSLHYDTRDNPITPTSGTNAAIKIDQYGESIGSDADFRLSQVLWHGFRPLGERWSLGGKAAFDTSEGDTPFFLAPSVDLRGIETGRFAGNSALSTEVELRRVFDERWAGVAFGGYGETFVNESRIFEAESGIWTGGVGIRYRIARLQGIDFGIDVARGPEQTIFYFQFGHAWGRTMD